MALKKSPILIVLLILGGVALFLLAGVTVVGHFFGTSGSPLSFGAKIGVIPIEGTLEDSHHILSQIVQFREDNSIRAILLRINSPGGRVAPAQEIYREIRRTTQRKRVIVSMGDVAASGGYYVAAAADRIVANPGTILGSIGVIMEFLQVQELLKKAGVGLEVLKSGEFKDIGSPHREMTPRERALMMEMLHDIQDQFVQAVAQGRKIPREEIERIADGRVFSGKRGKELGLVDQLGNFQDAVTLAKRMTGIQGDVTLVYPEKPSIGLLELLAETTARGVIHVLQEFLGPRMAYRWDGWATQSMQPEPR
ncbi:MAG: signal peptide peptidase SppA [Desulfobacteraceae bacterium]|jgi:protease-4